MQSTGGRAASQAKALRCCCPDVNEASAHSFVPMSLRVASVNKFCSEKSLGKVLFLTGYNAAFGPMCVCVFCFGGREGPGGLRSWVGGGVINHEELSFFFLCETMKTSMGPQRQK